MPLNAVGICSFRSPGSFEMHCISPLYTPFYLFCPYRIPSSLVVCFHRPRHTYIACFTPSFVPAFCCYVRQSFFFLHCTGEAAVENLVLVIELADAYSRVSESHSSSLEHSGIDLSETLFPGTNAMSRRSSEPILMMRKKKICDARKRTQDGSHERYRDYH